MRKKALKKDFRMEVKKSMNRFISILFIVAMGVAMFSGIQASAPDMRYTGDVLFDETNLMDVRVVGTLGLTWDDIEALAQLEGVHTVEAGYMTDVLSGTGERQTVLHIESLLETLNQVTVKEGRTPQKSGECFLDYDYMQKWGYQVGDEIEVILPEDEEEDIPQDDENGEADAAGEEETEDPLLRTTAFQIVGCGSSSAYLSHSRGSSSLGNGEVSGFMYILPEDFNSEVYMVAYMTVDGAKEEVAYTEAYEQLVEQVLEGAESIQDVRCEIRYREVLEEAQATLDEHKADLAEGESELANAKQELEDGRKEAESELAKAKEDLESGESELADGKQQLQEKEKELADAKQKIADGEAEIADKEAQLANARQQLTAGETQLKSAEKQLKEKQAEYDSQAVTAESELAAGQQEIDSARQQIESGLAQVESESQKLEEAARQSSAAAATLEASQAEYDAGAAALASGEQSYAEGKTALDAAWAEYYANEEIYNQQKQSYDAGAANLEVLKSQRDGANASAAEQRNQAESLKNANSTLQGEIDGLNGEIAFLQGQLGTLQEEIAGLESQISGWQSALEEEKAKGEDASEERITELEGQIADANTQIAAKNSSIDSAQTEMESKRGAVDEKNAQISSNTEAITAAEAAASEQEAAAAALEPGIAQLSQELEASKPALDAAEQQLAAGKAELDQKTAELDAARAELDTQTATLAGAKEQLDAGWAELTAGQEQISAGKTQLEQSKAQLESGQQELDANQQKIDAGKAQLESGKAQLDEAWKEINSNKSKLKSSRTQVENGESQLAAGKQTLIDSKNQVSDGEQQIADAWVEIEENEQKLKDGWADYEEGKKEAESEIQDGEKKIEEAEAELADAREKLADAQKEIDEIDEPEWYVHDRAIYTDYSGLGENAERMVNIGEVFPTLFFLVAALISLTTMTRMVEEQRTQIGTLKALGYGKVSIASKYMKYALFATLGGSALGFLIGEKLLPYIIVWAYGMMYPNLRSPVIPYNWELGLMATGAALVCTLGATFASCYKELASTPAVLMRPPAPKEGKRVLLERIPFLWKRLSFSWKSTIRNLFRYKKRFFMTIIGIGGCMGLLLVGFGLNDSIVGIGDLQYKQLQTYDLMTILDEGSSNEEQQALLQYIEKQVGTENLKEIYMQKISATDGKKEYNPYLFVPENTEALQEFLVLRDRVSHEAYELTDEGAIVTEKLASMMNLEVGDEIVIVDDERGKRSIPIVHIAENYLYHYIYLTPAVYQQIYGEPVEYNAVLVKAASGEKEDMQKLGENILDMEGSLNVTYTHSIAEQLEDMLGSLDVVIGVLIVCAGMLAFVVLYNLNNININERKRELATLKVLGFYDSEVAAYVYRENILLTLIGAAVGIVMGIFLHRFIITTVEVDACMFGRNINLISFVYGTLFTIGFSAIVNGVMFFKLKKIDMVESLKSVE